VLLFLRVGDEREAKTERDEVEPGGSMHCGSGWQGTLAATRAGQALRCTRGSMLSSWHFRQVATPRKVQMMQMNVPQFAHG
jgi:hypothetical protein